MPDSPEYVLGIQLNVPSNVTRAVWRARKYLGRYYGSQEFDPHITLYLARFTPTAFRQLVQHLKTQPLPIYTVHLGGLAFTPLRQGEMLVRLSARRTQALLQLHTLIVHHANPFRHGLIRKKDLRKIQKNIFSKSETIRIQKYGYSRVLKNFHPHITLGVVPKQSSTQATRHKINKILHPLRHTSWTARSLTVGLYRYNSTTEEYLGKPKEYQIGLGI